MGPMRIGPGTELGLQAASRDQSSSSRQTERAVQALQMGRASSMVPSGSGMVEATEQAVDLDRRRSCRERC